MLLNRFLRDRGGNVALMFGLAIVPVMGVAGVAVDYGRAGSVRTSMQSALDSTGLMLAKEAQTLTAEQLTQKGKAYFSTTFNHPEAKNLNVTVTFTPDADGALKIKVSAAADLDTTVSGVLGLSQMKIGSSSEVTWGMRKLELALALDNTGSMDNSNKMTELKNAAKNLLDTLKANVKKDGDVKVAIIPFNTDVNVGKKNDNATWLDWDSDFYCTADGCVSGFEAVKKAVWKGCVSDRDQDNDVKDTAPSAGNTSTLFPAHLAAECPVEMQPLTTNWGQLVSSVESMKPKGNTNVTIGLSWAWHALTAGAPLTEAAAPAKDLDKVIILLTDGDNTENRWSKNSADIDARTKKACDNIKAEKDADGKPLYTIYTIRVIDGNADLLRSCASDAGKYYDVQNAGQLSDTFNKIGKNLAKLRIAK